MTMQAESSRSHRRPPMRTAPTAPDIEGAAQVFLRRASTLPAFWRDRARGGRVEGHALTLFENKEQLFEAIVHAECRGQAESIFDLDRPTTTSNRADAARRRFREVPGHPQKLSPMRTVIAIADAAGDRTAVL